MDNDILLLEGEDVDFIWDSVQKIQLIFHPDIAPYGVFDFEKFFSSKSKKPFILFLDRNILISLLKFCENGSLKNKGEAQLVGLVMAWAEMNNIAISAGMAIQERSTQLKNQEEGLIELQKFLEIFDYYPMQVWLNIAEGISTEIAPIHYSGKPAGNISAIYSKGNDHYYMALASLIHMVFLYRDNSMSPAEKIKEFFSWMIENLLVGEYLLTYAALLFTNHEGIKAPKNAGSNDLDRIVTGCENQAWDISYLTNWSVWYSNTHEYNEEFLFATNDVLLKKIFVYQNNPYRFNGVLFNVLSKSDYTDVSAFIEEQMKTRIKPDFGKDPISYFNMVVEQEKQRLLASDYKIK